MKTLLYTGHDAAYKPLADITVPRMAEYAEQNNMDFTCYTEPLVEGPQGIYWTGVCGALRAFREGYDAIMYLDVDQLITGYNHSWDFSSFKGLSISKDWGEDAIGDDQFSACGFIARNDDDSLRFFKSVRLMMRARGEYFPEQEEMRSTYRHQKSYGHDWVHVQDRKVFNCVPDAVCPGKVPEPWVKGDFAAHITMVDLPRRIEIAKDILSKL